jgi:hypothetical protein
VVVLPRGKKMERKKNIILIRNMLFYGMIIGIYSAAQFFGEKIADATYSIRVMRYNQMGIC